MALHDSRAILGGLEDILGDGEDAAVRGGGGGCITMFEGNYCRCKISVPICKDFHVGGYLQAAVQYSLLLSEYMGINLESYAVMTYANTTIVGWLEEATRSKNGGGGGEVSDVTDPSTCNDGSSGSKRLFTETTRGTDKFKDGLRME